MHFLVLQENCQRCYTLDLNTKTIFIFRHVTHQEHILPYCIPNQPFHWTYHSNHPIAKDVDTEPDATNAYNNRIENLNKKMNSIIFDNHEHNPQLIWNEWRSITKWEHISTILLNLGAESTLLVLLNLLSD